ncbi:hypothetical protein [Maribacter sp. 2304DJ31-5]|uniref:hypothetical protein n=1 Tax=Maribacter sp. 2304DJ31-5 TaxID=3386273 RepID=UPI0039BCD8F4
MDNFEKHIRENSGLFDEHKANRKKMWLQITSKLKDERFKVIPLWKSPILKIAASIILILGIAGIIGLSFFNANIDRGTQYASKELLDIDMHYRNLISYQVKLVENHLELTEADKTDFLSFMDELDHEYGQLRLEMHNNLDNEIILEAIIANYKKRIELIENLLKQINDSKIQNDDYGYIL